MHTRIFTLDKTTLAIGDGVNGKRVAVTISKSAAPVCAEKARLLRFRALAESHQRAIHEFARFIGKLRQSDFNELLDEFGETARKIANEAQEAVDRHTAEHGC